MAGLVKGCRACGGSLTVTNNGLKREGLLGDDVVDGDVDLDVAEAGLITQLSGDPLLHVPCDGIEFLGVLGGDGEVDDGGAAQAPDFGAGVPVRQGRGLGRSGYFGVGAAAADNVNTGDLTGGFASDPGHDPGADPDGPAVSEVEVIPDLGSQPADLTGHSVAHRGGERDGSGFVGEN